LSDQAVVLAGGLATRLGERTRRLPKFLLPVAGRPFAAWLLERLRRSGFSEVVLCIGHLGAEIRDLLGDGSAFGLTLRYSDDGEQLLGTGGALRQALGLLAPRTLVTYGDSFLPFDYQAPLRDLEQHPEAAGTLAVYRNDNRFDRSNVRVVGDRCVEYRKTPRHEPPDPSLRDIDYGAMALCRSAIEATDLEPPFGLERIQAALAASGTLRAYRAERRFFEIGSAEGLAALEAELTRCPPPPPTPDDRAS
jgi:NDP-sugar pyrophosphorylase family protein